MEAEYVDPGGIIVPHTSLQLRRARIFAQLVWSRRLAYVSPVECRQRATPPEGDGTETIVVELEVERPQHLVHDIRRVERVAVRFEPNDNSYPEVLALRSDFPRVSHTNVRTEELPRSLCIYDQPWSQVALRWTPASYIERMRFWLAETAKGTLHRTDQHLEPLLLGTGLTIILPADLFEGKSDGEYDELRVGWATKSENCRVLISECGKGDRGAAFLAMAILAKPQTHGTIRHRPQNLHDLDSLLRSAGIPLLDYLRDRLRDWNSPELWDKRLLLIVAFPLMRESSQVVEATDLWAFLTGSSVADVGIAIGIWEKSPDSKLLGHMLARAPEADGHTVPLDTMSAQFSLTRELAAAASSLAADSRRVVAVGTGALGSQVIRLLAQSGFGKWTLIDEDVLLPHNTVRHALGSGWVGFPKTVPLALEIDQLYLEPEATTWIEADILNPDDQRVKINEALAKADLILDLAASIPVERHLSSPEAASARRISLFLNPRGTDLVLLAEDARRSVPLDCLEMQYYRAVATASELTTHLRPPDGRIRYARSCRDVTSVIPNHLITLHSAIGAKAVREVVTADAATIRVWQAEGNDGGVRALTFPVTPIRREKLGEWTLVVSDDVLARLNNQRVAKLPNETGGVLIGSYDLVRRTVYVVDTIPSPPDSAEWPTLYIRGSAGLFSEVERIRRATDDQLEYVGEWHSHPDGCPCLPSEDDLLVFSWLTENMADAGLPALMAISGERGAASWYLGQMLRSGGWEIGL